MLRLFPRFTVLPEHVKRNCASTPWSTKVARHQWCIDSTGTGVERIAIKHLPRGMSDRPVLRVLRTLWSSEKRSKHACARFVSNYLLVSWSNKRVAETTRVHRLKSTRTLNQSTFTRVATTSFIVMSRMFREGSFFRRLAFCPVVGLMLLPSTNRMRRALLVEVQPRGLQGEEFALRSSAFTWMYLELRLQNVFVCNTERETNWYRLLPTATLIRALPTSTVYQRLLSVRLVTLLRTGLRSRFFIRSSRNGLTWTGPM